MGKNCVTFISKIRCQKEREHQHGVHTNASCFDIKRAFPSALRCFFRLYPFLPSFTLPSHLPISLPFLLSFIASLVFILFFLRLSSLHIAHFFTLPFISFLLFPPSQAFLSYASIIPLSLPSSFNNSFPPGSSPSLLYMHVLP